MEKESKIRKILVEVLEMTEGDVQNIGIEEELTEYNLDSLTAIELIVNLESVFDIVIDDEDLLIENVSSIEKIIAVVNKYIEA